MANAQDKQVEDSMAMGTATRPETMPVGVRGVNAPSMSRLQHISLQYGLDCNDEELEVYKEKMIEVLRAFKSLAAMTEPIPEVKYPRTPGYRPKPQDNPYNAWYWRCDIRGACTGLLAGRTVAIKDSIQVAGVPMMNGSRVLEGFMPPIDATVVTRVLDAGGHITGKAACEDMCLSGSGSMCGTGPVRNPHKEGHVTGGSSSGCAALVAAREVDMAIGGDQGGSVRFPACWSGIVGLKPTYGLVPYTGACSMERSLDHLGPMAATVRDCALLLQTIAGYDDGNDTRQPRDLRVPNYTEQLKGDPKQLKIGVVKEGFANCHDPVNGIVRGALDKLRAAGATVEDVSIPAHIEASGVFTTITAHGIGESMLKAEGVQIGDRGMQSTALADAQRRGFRAHSQYLSYVTKLFLLTSEYVREEYGFHFYSKARNISHEITASFNAALEKYDVLAMPTIVYPAPEIPTTTTPIGEMIDHSSGMLQNTAVFNVTGHPAISINAGFTADGLPVGLMLVGKLWDDVTVLDAAYAWERLRGADDTPRV
ncbi:PREDICTED: amidase-like isoform X2 [Priapulus caudatus]|uniref:Amidase-like isoform X2 n=1 Tax=Priapulus caudatus TaxID=37621 RepID=A0ABM1EN09_PRICU|nr:PREDICTED: amidase-like isoform X2 [Priapulus caudatus]